MDLIGRGASWEMKWKKALEEITKSRLTWIGNDPYEHFHIYAANHDPMLRRSQWLGTSLAWKLWWQCEGRR